MVICGHPNSDFEGVQEILNSAGVGLPKPSRHELISSNELHEKIFRSYELDPSNLDPIAPIKLGKIWQYLAIDLFMGNMDQTNWGWGDNKSAWLLDFWKDQDPQVSFVLVYSAPETVLGKALMNRDVASSEIDFVLSSWIAYQSEILRFYKQNPERCLLVNALATRQDPNSLIKKANTTFSMELSDISMINISVDNVSFIAETLSKALIDDDHQANILYRELESLADIANTVVSVCKDNHRRAFEEFIALLNEVEISRFKNSQDREYINQLEQKQIDLEAEIQKLSQSNDDRDNMNNQRKVLIQKLMQARDEKNTLLPDDTKMNEININQVIPEGDININCAGNDEQEELENYFKQWQELLHKD